MSTKEKVYSLIDLINPADMETIYQILKRFALTSELPNQETIEAMLESDEIAHDQNIKGYTNMADLMEALDAE